MSLAYMVAYNCNETIEEIVWYMPIQMVFRLVAITSEALTGKKVLTHRDRYIADKMTEKLEELIK